MIFEQFYLGCLAQASYLIGDEETKTAVIVDPRRDVELYIDEAKARGLEIKHVFLTHFHADFVAGHLELRDRTGAAIHLGARAQASYAFTPAREGEDLRLGKLRLAFLETPGHTPEGISILVYDEARDAEAPWAVLTGDTLFVGDVGRPDLMASAGLTAVELAGQLYDSLHEKLLKLPDATRVYPAHGAGSMCGRALGSENHSSIGEQRKLNYALQPMSKDDFIALIAGNQPAAPPYFAYDAALNKAERPGLDAALAGFAVIDLDALLAHQSDGAQVLDVRDPGAFAASHLKGSLNVGLDGKFATWAGSVLDPERDVVVIAPRERGREAATRLGRVGIDRVRGAFPAEQLAAALDEKPALRGRVPRIEATDLARRLREPAPPLILDVRGDGERAQGSLAGSLHVPLQELSRRLDEVPRDRQLILHCAGGYRSMVAASLLRARGLPADADLIGGYKAWTEAGLPIAVPVEA